MASNLKVSIGCDPEIFLRDKKSGAFVSAHDKMPGTKLEPYVVELGAVQVDGVAAEFNITPTYSAAEFVRNIGKVKGSIKKFVGDTIELVEEPIAIFEPGYFKSLPEEVRELGCNPDWNAWTGQVNEKPDGTNTTMRTAAGHLHIGWGDKFDISDPTHIEDCRIVAKQLDYYIGIASLYWDKDTKRRSLYGKAGAFRPKPYGVEYRPLSNVWLRSPQLQSWIWDSAFKAVYNLIADGIMIEDVWGDAAQHIIDENIKWWEDSKFFRIYRDTGLSTPPYQTLEKKEEVSQAVKRPRVKKNPGFTYASSLSPLAQDFIVSPVTTGGGGGTIPGTPTSGTWSETLGQPVQINPLIFINTPNTGM